jgi:hypothetical protein
MSKRKRTILTNSEPSCEHLIESTDFDYDVFKIVNWHRGHPATSKIEKKWVLDYITNKFGKKEVANYSHGDSGEYGMVAPYCRVLTKLPKDFKCPDVKLLAMVDRQLATIKMKTRQKMSKRSKNANPDSPTISIKERIETQIHELVGDIERQIDFIFENPETKKTDWFRIDKWLIASKVKGPQSDAILKKIKGDLNELQDALDGSCPQLKEGFDFLTKKNLRRIVDCFQTWQFHVEKHIDGMNKTKSYNKKRKVSSPEKRVKKVSYLDEYKQDKLDLKSIHPKDIIHSYVTVVYDTKNRLVTVFVAKQSEQLDIQGTTVYNYSEENSYTKKVRQPMSVTGVCSGSRNKNILLEYLDDIKTKKQTVRKRLNKNTVILKAF